jgi:hypothetical protein
VLSDYRRVAVAFLGPETPEIVVEVFRSQSDEEALVELQTMQDALHKLLPALFPMVKLPTGPVSIPIGVDPEAPAVFAARFLLQGRQLTNELVSAQRGNLALAMLDDMLRRPRRCPLWACETCGRVIVQPTRGRTVRFCSPRCKAQGIPSAPKRAYYVAQHRRRKRQSDLGKAVRVIERIATSRQYEALSRAFRNRPRKALLYLLRMARAETVTQKER